MIAFDKLGEREKVEEVRQLLDIVEA